MSDLVGNPEDRVSHNEAHVLCMCDYFFRSVSYVESLSDFIDSEDEFTNTSRKTPKRKQESGKLTRSARYENKNAYEN